MLVIRVKCKYRMCILVIQLKNKAMLFYDDKQDFTSKAYKYNSFSNAISGATDCQPKQIQAELYILANNKSINAFDICPFSPERFNNVKLQSRCATKHFERGPLRTCYTNCATSNTTLRPSIY